jgi:hypothetical protein
MGKWRNGQLANWENGEMGNWRNGKWRNGKLAKWETGKMGNWRNGKMAKREMAIWEDTHYDITAQSNSCPHGYDKILTFYFAQLAEYEMSLPLKLGSSLTSGTGINDISIKLKQIKHRNSDYN